MENLGDIIKSDEMDNVISAIEALRKRYIPEPLREKPRYNPADFVYEDKYRADIVLKLLLDDKIYYDGYKKILAAGFGGWLTSPDDQGFWSVSVVKAALLHMKNAVKRADDGEPLTIRQDVAARYIFTGTDFLTEVYERIGGYDAFAVAPSFHDTWVPESEIKAAFTAARAIGFLHHGIDRASKIKSYFAPSLNKAVMVFDALRECNELYFTENYVGRSLLHKRWSNSKETLALLYAASTIRVKGKSLLEIVLAGSFTYGAHGKYLHRWVGRARYVAAFVFARMGDGELVTETYRLLGDGEKLEFSPVKLDETEHDVVSRELSRYFK